MILSFTNIVMFNIYGNVFSINMLFDVGEGMDVFSWSFIPLKTMFFYIFIYVLMGVLLVLPSFKWKSKGLDYSLEFRLVFSTFLVCLSLCAFSFLLIGVEKKYNNRYGAIIENSKYNFMQYYASTSKNSAFKKFGMATFFLEEYNVYTIDKQAIEADDEYNDLRGYFAKPQNTDSEFTGILRGKNVITILAESIQPFAINEYLTPTLYHLLNNGLNFTNNYSYNKTDHSEMISFAGNKFNESGLQTHFVEYQFPFSLPNLLNKNYKTQYFHDNVGSFYRRSEFNKMFGFEHLYFHDDIYPGEDMWSWGSANYTPDLQTMNKIVDVMVPNERFYSYWSSLGTHGPYVKVNGDNYNYYNNQGYFKEISDAQASGKLINPMKTASTKLQFEFYMAKVMDFDRAVKVLVDKLEEKGILDDTLIVIFGDHQAYYDNFNYKVYGIDESAYYNPQLYKTLMIMYNNDLTTAYKKAYGNNKVNKFTSPMMIVPTVLDLLGYNYNANYYYGKSLFESSYGDVYYNTKEGVFLNENFYSENGETIIFALNSDIQAQRMFLAECKSLKNRIENINNLYRYKYLNGTYSNVFGHVSYESMNYR